MEISMITQNMNTPSAMPKPPTVDVGSLARGSADRKARIYVQMALRCLEELEDAVMHNKRRKFPNFNEHMERRSQLSAARVSLDNALHAMDKPAHMTDEDWDAEQELSAEIAADHDCETSAPNTESSATPNHEP